MNDEKPHDDVGGTTGGESYAGALRDRMDELLADPKSSARDIGILMRSMLGARKLELMERQIRILERKLGDDGGNSLAGMLRAANEYGKTHGGDEADVGK